MSDSRLRVSSAHLTAPHSKHVSNTTFILFNEKGELTSWVITPALKEPPDLRWDCRGELQVISFSTAVFPWICWRNTGDACYISSEENCTLLDDDTANKYFEYLHPVLRDFLAITPKLSSLDLLYLIKLEETLNQLQINTKELFLNLYQSPYPYNITTDQAIERVRRKNKTYVHDDEIWKVVAKIKNRLRSSGCTSIKIALLDSFTYFCEEQKNIIFSRSQLVEQWVKQYRKEHNDVNPFELLSMQRRTGYLALFNPKETDSITFFKTFLRGETLSEELDGLLYLRPVSNIKTRNYVQGSF